MGIDVTSAFSTFCSNLEIPQNIKDKVDFRMESIVKRINEDFWDIKSGTMHRMAVGSYGRNTAIKTSDIDLIVELPWEVYSRFDSYAYNGQSALLQAVKQSLQTTYPSSSISGDGQVVDIDFYDGIKFEVVPAFRYSSGGYCYADTNNGGKWKSMNPSEEMLKFVSKDVACSGNLTKLCRMLRAWKDNMNVNIPGVLIDTMAYDFISQYEHFFQTYLYFDWLSRDFFAYVINNESRTYWEKFESGERIKKENTYNIDSRAKKAYNLTLDAIAAESNYYMGTWYNKWREIYGSKFPSA